MRHVLDYDILSTYDTKSKITTILIVIGFTREK